MKVFSYFFFCTLCFFFCTLFAQERAEGELSETAKAEGAKAGNTSVFFNEVKRSLTKAPLSFPTDRFAAILTVRSACF